MKVRKWNPGFIYHMCVQSNIEIKTHPRVSKKAAQFGFKEGAQTHRLGPHRGPRRAVRRAVTATGCALTSSGLPAAPDTLQLEDGGVPVLRCPSSSASRSSVASHKHVVKKCSSSFLFQATPRATRPIWKRSQNTAVTAARLSPQSWACFPLRPGRRGPAQMLARPPGPVLPNAIQAWPCAFCALRLSVL